MKPGNLRSTKIKLKKNLLKQEKSTSLQLNVTKILKFLINDMLDYAQLSSGQFRKFFKKFNVVDSVEDVVSIMKFKAEKLGVEIYINFDNFENCPVN